MKVLIFGGTRFMGNYVCDELIASGFDVTIANRGTRETGSNVKHIVCDRSNPTDLDQFKNMQFDYIVDFSAYDSTWVAEAAEVFKNRVKKYLFISSGFVYRPSNVFPIPEHFPVEAVGLHREYADQKIKSEEILLESHAKGHFETILCRLPYVLGAGNYEDREKFVLSRLVNDKPIVVPDGGSALHSFIFAGDVAKAISKLLKADSRVAGHAFNIAIPNGITIMGFIEACVRVSGKSAKLHNLNLQKADMEIVKFHRDDLLFPFPQANGYLDSSKIFNFLGFVPTYTIDEMIEQYYKWWLTTEDLSPRSYESETKALAYLGLL